VNIMVDGTYFRTQAKRCRELSQQCFDLTVAEQLRVLSESFEAKARDLDRASRRRGPGRLRTEIARYTERLRQLAVRYERWLNRDVRMG
jgi:hypothetical protein